MEQTLLSVPALQIAYFSVLVFALEAKALDVKWLEYSAKPLLMPVLGLLLYASPRASSESAFAGPLGPVLVSLVFAWLGDVFLLLDRGFKAGLGAFFLMHCVYVRLLWSSPRDLVTKPANLVPAILLTIAFFTQYTLVRDNLGPIRPAAVAYFLAFSLVMLLAAVRYIAAPTGDNAALLLGLFLFYVSDSLLALSLFHRDFSLSGVAVMLTYGLGQYMFLTSFLRSTAQR